VSRGGATTTRTLSQAERRSSTRAKLVKAAGKVFARNGFHGASLDEIAAGAGVSKGALYYNFDSKEDVFLTLLDESLRARLNSARIGSDELAGDPISAVRRFIEAAGKDSRWPPLFFEFIAYAARRPQVREEFARRFVRAGREEIAAVIAEHTHDRESTLPMASPDLAVVLSALVNGLLIERVFDPAAVPDELIDRAVALVLGATGEQA
jgi:AcrR family transcriptional regulator